MSSNDIQKYFIVGPANKISQDFIRSSHIMVADYNLRHTDDEYELFPIVELEFKFSDHLDEVYLYDKTEADKNFQKIMIKHNPVTQNVWYTEFLKRKIDD